MLGDVWWAALAVYNKDKHVPCLHATPAECQQAPPHLPPHPLLSVVLGIFCFIFTASGIMMQG
jgi:hypothetical protein